jgi:hypothetical protein
MDERGGRQSRFWALFTFVGLAVWIGATVAAAVINDDPADPGPVLIAFVAGGGTFFALMFGAALREQIRSRPAGEQGRFWRRVAIGYTVTGAVVTALGLAAIIHGGIGGGDPRAFIYPLVGIVAVWALAALLLLNRLRGGS